MLALRAARLFDGESAEVIERPLLLIEDGRITAVEKGGVQPPAGAEVLDLGDVTLLPGLIDVHVHLGFDASPDPVAQMKADDDLTLLLRMRHFAQQAMLGGVTTVRDLGDRNFLAINLREWFRQNAEPGPEILAAGPPVTPTGGHCHFMNGEADGELDVRRGVRLRVKRGADVIKVMSTGGHMTPGTNPLQPQYTTAELAAAVEEAHRLNKRLTAHAHGANGIERCVEAGVDGIEHCSFQTPDGIHAEQSVIERIAEQRIAVAPTIGRPPGQTLPPAFAVQQEARRNVLERMYRAGVNLVTGTDAGIMGVPHDSARYSIVAFGEAGMRPHEALRTATAAAADACGIGDRKGRLAPGHEADILAVTGNPLTNLTDIHNVRAVFRAGTRVR
jgi:imidazolonepropionase-like amidohydrolase